MTEIADGQGQEKPRQRRRTDKNSAQQVQLTPLQQHDLELLERAIAAHNRYEEESDEEDAWLVQAINRSVYAAYLDCIEEGVGESAKDLMRRELHVDK